MAERLLLIYATTDGHTLHICERLKFLMTAQGQRVTLVPIEQASALNLANFERIVIGASIRYGHHQPQVAQFIAKHQAVLESRPSAFFSVNVVARKPDKNTPETNPYARKFLQGIAWKPQLAAVFAGKLDYPRYGFFDRHMIRLIMWMSHGPTDTKAVVEFTDWAKVEAFGREMCALKA
ncbi:MAG: menaquinone-dependent protoporphyrinogen IX dehydrogenase [Rhodoferax sp.]|uniref:menaquinone-dependent protoporphyrinogen IX dehydrogenase n=1 Tax=Rhodoferax sp. TaxID=50421 RepID=UPI0026188877|nr:menaquinone-dependent protoporphyrinogen IX dehydrogenase [Rhodoferax sp.]MDD2881804.1 menaquinone-dependent protoporphyrinogen IX dehydrogenase [Rhodoferax sp.]